MFVLRYVFFSCLAIKKLTCSSTKLCKAIKFLLRQKTELQSYISNVVSANKQLHVTNINLQEANNSLQREIFMLQHPPNSNLRSSFPTVQEILGNYIEIVEQDVVNLISDFPATEERVKLIAHTIIAIQNITQQNFRKIVDKICKTLKYSTIREFESSGIYHELLLRLKSNYRSYLSEITLQDLEYEFVQNEDESKAILQLATKLEALMWQIRLSGLQLVEPQSSSFYRTIGNETGKEICIINPIANRYEIVQKGYVFRVCE